MGTKQSLLLIGGGRPESILALAGTSHDAFALGGTEDTAPGGGQSLAVLD